MYYSINKKKFSIHFFSQVTGHNKNFYYLCPAKETISPHSSSDSTIEQRDFIGNWQDG